MEPSSVHPSAKVRQNKSIKIQKKSSLFQLEAIGHTLEGRHVKTGREQAKTQEEGTKQSYASKDQEHKRKKHYAQV